MSDVVTAQLLDVDGATVLHDLDEAFQMEFQDALNVPGTGKLSLMADDGAVADAASGTFVQFSLNGTPCFTFMVEAVERVLADGDEEAGEVVTLSGRSWEVVLDDARVFHELEAAQVPPADWRPFGFGSSLYDDTTWSAVHSIGAVNTATYWSVSGKNAPVDFPDPAAEWIWVPVIDFANPPVGISFFRETFTLGAETDVFVAGSGARRWTLYLDAIAILGERDDPVAWQGYKGVKLRLAAGTHTVGIVGEADAGTPAAAGVVCSILGLDSEGKPDPTDVKLSTKVSGWKGLDYPGIPPGLTASAILLQLISEAAARSCLLPNTSTFDAVDDSNAVGFGEVPEFAAGVGDSLLDVVTKMAAEATVDYRMDPAALDLKLYRPGELGSASGVTLAVGTNIVDLAHEQAAPLITRLLVKYGGGFLTVEDAVLIAAGKVHERFLTLAMGNASEAQAAAERILDLYADETPAVTCGLEPTGGDLPYTDFTVGDTLDAPNEAGTPTSYRVLSITCQVDDDLGTPVWGLELNRRRQDPAERQLILLQSLGNTVVGDTPGSAPASKGGYGFTPSTPFYDFKPYTGQPAVNPVTTTTGGVGAVEEVLFCWAGPVNELDESPVWKVPSSRDADQAVITFLTTDTTGLSVDLKVNGSVVETLTIAPSDPDQAIVFGSVLSLSLGDLVNLELTDYGDGLAIDMNISLRFVA